MLCAAWRISLPSVAGVTASVALRATLAVFPERSFAFLAPGKAAVPLKRRAVELVERGLQAPRGADPLAGTLAEVGQELLAGLEADERGAVAQAEQVSGQVDLGVAVLARRRSRRDPDARPRGAPAHSRRAGIGSRSAAA